MTTQRSNGKKSPVPESMGSFKKNLETPVIVGEVTLAEISEIRERSRLIDVASRQVEEFNSKAVDSNRTKALLESERTFFMQAVCGRHGLSMDNDYRIDINTGAISLIAEKIEAEIQELRVVDEQTS